MDCWSTGEWLLPDYKDHLPIPRLQLARLSSCFPISRTQYQPKSNTRKPFSCNSRKYKAFQAACYCVIDKRECEDQKTQGVLPQQETETYPNAIFYDFESYHDCKPQKNKVTASLMYENAHVPISVSIGHIYDPRPKELIRKFMQELERHGKDIRAVVRAELMPEDIDLVPRNQRRVIVEWCD